MSDLKKRVDDSESFYNNTFLAFDFQLADFNFATLKPYFNGKHALELGPASGFMTKLLVEEFEMLDVVDGSEYLLNQIPDYKNITKTHSLFEDFHTDRKYDSIIMSHVLEHIESPVPVLKKICEWLRDTGVFLISVPNAKSIHRIVAVEMGLLKSVYELNSRDHELGHCRVYDMETLRSHVEEAGLKVKDSGGIFLKPVSNGQIDTNWTPDMIEGFYKAGKYFPDNCAEIFVVCTK